MKTVYLNVIGKNQANAALKALPAKADTALSRTIRQACIIVAADAKERAPNDRGSLGQSVTQQVIDKGQGSYEGQVGTKALHGLFQEYGTKGHWTPITADIERWIRRKKLEDVLLIREGLWIKSRRTGKIMFVPFDSSPRLRRWAEKRGLLKKKAIWFSGRAHPFLRPALLANLATIKAMLEKTTREIIQFQGENNLRA